MQFEKSFALPMAPATLWPLLLDIKLICSCMAGASLSREAGPGAYEGTITMSLGPVSLTFAARVTLEKADPAEQFVWIGTRGKDAGHGGGFVMVSELHLQPAPGGSKIELRTDMKLTGAFAGYNDVGVVTAAGDYSAAQFAQNLKARLVWRANGASGSAPPPIAAKPMSTTSLVGNMLRRAIVKPFGRS